MLLATDEQRILRALAEILRHQRILPTLANRAKTSRVCLLGVPENDNLFGQPVGGCQTQKHSSTGHKDANRTHAHPPFQVGDARATADAAPAPLRIAHGISALGIISPPRARPNQRATVSAPPETRKLRLRRLAGARFERPNGSQSAGS